MKRLLTYMLMAGLMTGLMARSVWSCDRETSDLPQPEQPVTRAKSDSVSVVSTETLKAADSAYDIAYRLYESGEGSAACQAFTEILRKYPGTPAYPLCLLHLASIQYIAGKYHAAAGHVDELLEKYPDHDGVPRALLLKGFILFDTHREYDEASRLFWIVVNEHPKSMDAPAALLALAEVSVVRNDYIGALHLYSRIIADYPCTPQAQNALEHIENTPELRFHDDDRYVPGDPLDSGMERT